ncbi:MAG: MORN repeat-containing protein [Rhizobiaceae bacterium]
MLATAGFFLLACSAGAKADDERGAAWAQRAQIVYLGESRSVERRIVRVRDPHPDKNLEFVWEPDPADPLATIAADGTVNGKGTLTWRVRGTASYDPRGVYSVYRGEMRGGQPHGEGRLELRSGAFFDGVWAEGRMEGRGVWLDEAGNRYEGAFRAGVAHGAGRYLSRTGEIFAGTFDGGQRHGKGTTTMAGGTRYESTWDRGKEVGGNRPDALADARIGGLIKAQSGGDADRLEISAVVDERMNQEAGMQYQHLVQEQDIAIYPRDEEVNNAWNGTGAIGGDYIFAGVDWEDGAPAFVEVGVQTTDGGRAKMEGLELQVAYSDAYRKPMMSIEQHLGCVGFRPTFSFLNHGWGAVRDATITIAFRGLDHEGPTSRGFTRTIANFDNGIDVDIEDVLAEAGVDTAKLAGERFSCPSVEGLAVCRNKVMNDVGFGELLEYVYGDDKLATMAVGRVDYSWEDDHGRVTQQSEPFQSEIALTTIELPVGLAECGDGFGGSPEALRYQDIEFPIGQQNYVVDLPMRGNKNIASYAARLKMRAAMTSFHSFEVVAKLADGSQRRSKPISFYYFRPRPSDFQSSVPLPACYLDPSGGC